MHDSQQIESETGSMSEALKDKNARSDQES
jgi:hypothetical protein